MVEISQSVIKTIYSHAEEAYPEECCGCLSSYSLDRVITEAIKCANIQDKIHEENPDEFPDSAKNAYYIDPEQVLRVMLGLEKKGYTLSGFYHSHVHGEAYFSQTDRKKAMWDGNPICPDTHYIVVSVKGSDIKSYKWDPGQNDFIEEEIEIVPDLA